MSISSKSCGDGKRAKQQVEDHWKLQSNSYMQVVQDIGRLMLTL